MIKMELQFFGGGRFSGGPGSRGGGAAMAAAAPAAPAAQMTAAAPPPPPPPPPPAFDDTDSGPYRAIADERGYYQKQNLTPNQLDALDNYRDPNTQPGSLYNFSQNMNYNKHNGLPMTRAQSQTFDTIVDATHNLGQNMELTRYDHIGSVQEMLRAAGAPAGTRMTPASLKKALVGKTYQDDRILSTSHNNFQNSRDPSTFTTRQFKMTYRASASAQGLAAGIGKTPLRGSGMSRGDNFGEILLAPSGTRGHNNFRIVDVRYSGSKARPKGGSKHNLSLKQIEIVVEVD